MVRMQLRDLDLEQIARSGQCFRLRSLGDGIWSIAAAGEYVEAVQDKEDFLFSCGEEAFKAVWQDYFDLDTDYGSFKNHVAPEDAYLQAAVRAGWGVRILKQELWEMLVTFLISQNNNITRNTASVDALCKRYGSSRCGLGFRRLPDGSFIEEERSYAAFPKPEAILEAGLKGLSNLGLGYRDKYLLAIAERCSGEEGRLWLDSLKGADYKEAHALLMEQYGIGRKVADCVCLFGLHHVGAFPVDTHIKQILEAHYPSGFPMERYEGYGGILQQYLFYYKRNGENSGVLS